MVVGSSEAVYNSNQKRQILRQIKEYFDKEWLKRRAEGRLSKKKIILPNAKPKKKEKEKEE